MKFKLYLVSGSDQEKINSESLEIIHQLTNSTINEPNLDIIQETDNIDSQQMLLNGLESLQTFSLFGEKTIWLKNFPLEKEPKVKDDSQWAQHFTQLLESIRNLDGMNLIISGIGINRTKRLYKLANELGKVLIFDKIDMKNRNWQKKVTQEIELVAQKKASLFLQLSKII